MRTRRQHLKEIGELFLILLSVAVIVWALSSYVPSVPPAESVSSPTASTEPCGGSSHAPMEAKEAVWKPEIPWNNPDWTKR